MSDIEKVMEFLGVDEDQAKHVIEKGFDINRLSTESVVKVGKGELESIKNEFISDSQEVREEIELEITNQNHYQNHQ
jgi:hypothetical protein